MRLLQSPAQAISYNLKGRFLHGFQNIWKDMRDMKYVRGQEDTLEIGRETGRGSFEISAVVE